MNEPPSKSARKRAHQALQTLGEKLIELTAQELERIPLDEDLRNAIVEAQGMKAYGALRRQRQLVGKLMARADGEAIREAYERLQSTGHAEKARFRQAEYWRDRLVREGRPAERALCDSLAQDIEGLSALLDEYGQSRDDDARRRVSRKIFRSVHAALGAGMQNGRS